MHKFDNVPELMSRSSWCEISVSPGDMNFQDDEELYRVQEVKGPRDLVQIIKDNPGCHAVIDNDCWDLFPSKEYFEHRYGINGDMELLATSDDEIKPLNGSTYQDNHCYGGSILLALAEIVGMTVESV